MSDFLVGLIGFLYLLAAADAAIDGHWVLCLLFLCYGAANGALIALAHGLQ